MLFEVYKGVSSVLGHPCQTEENIADALIIAGEAAKNFIEDPPKAMENAVSSVSDWWNDKNTYEKIRTVVEAYIMYRMIASSRTKGKTVTLESEEAGEGAGKTAEAIGGAAGKGKIRIKSAGESGTKSSGLPDWLKEKFEAGNNFNRENRPRYPYNEVEVYGKKKYVVDSYVPSKEIVSCKYTQLADVKKVRQ